MAVQPEKREQPGAEASGASMAGGGGATPGGWFRRLRWAGPTVAILAYIIYDLLEEDTLTDVQLKGKKASRNAETGSWMAESYISKVPSTAYKETLKAIADMKDNPEKPQVLSNNCNILSKHGYALSNKDWMGEAGGIDVAAAAMKRFPQQKELQIRCAHALGGMCLFNEGTTTMAGEAGAVELVVDLMRRWPNDPSTQIGGVSGCFMDFSAKNRARWRDAGGIELNLQSIKRFYSNPEVVLQATYGFSSGTQYPNEYAFKEAGAIPVLTQLMRDHPKSHRVREEVMAGTQSLLGKHLPDLTADFVEQGYVPLLVQAMREAPMDKAQLAWGCNNLLKICLDFTEHRKHCAEEGAATQALAAVQNFPRMVKDPTHPDYGEGQYMVLEACTELMQILAAQPGVSSVLVSGGALKAAEAAVKLRPNSQRMKNAYRNLASALSS